MKDFTKSISAASKKLMLKEPYYGFFLLMLRKLEAPGMGTAGVSVDGINYTLGIDPEFWKHLSLDLKRGILKHECLHIIFQHLTTRTRYLDYTLFNYAADIEINQLIDKLSLPGGHYADKQAHQDDLTQFKDSVEADLKASVITKEEAAYKMKYEAPMRALFLEDFPELNMAANKGTHYYYEILKKGSDNKSQNGSSGSSLLDDMLDNPQGDQHTSWNAVDQMDDTAKKMLNNQADYLTKETANAVTKGSNPGSIPGELAEIIKDLMTPKPPKFNWKAYLRRFVDGSEMVDYKSSSSRINKRFPGLPGKKLIPKKHICVAIDTSGSVSNDEIAEFYNEILHMHKTGCTITVVHCDTEIAKVEKFKPSPNGFNVYGRGGTSFDPVIDFYNENYKIFTCLIYVTDGEASIPRTPLRGKMLWVLSSISHMNNALKEYAPVIKLNS